MNKIPINTEREILNNFLDRLVLFKSNLKRSNWYEEYTKNSKPDVIELYRLKFSIWIGDCTVFADKTIIKLLGLLPPGLGLRLLLILVNLKKKTNRHSK